MYNNSICVVPIDETNNLLAICTYVGLRVVDDEWVEAETGHLPIVLLIPERSPAISAIAQVMDPCPYFLALPLYLLESSTQTQRGQKSQISCVSCIYPGHLSFCHG